MMEANTHNQFLAGAKLVDNDGSRLVKKARKPLDKHEADRGAGLLRSPVEKRGYRMNEAVRYTGLSRSTLYELINDGTLPDLKIAGRRILPGEALDKLFESTDRK
jgi:excisionase family DNA binding protein